MDITDFLTALVKDKHTGVALDEFQVVEMVRDLSARLNKFITLNVLTELATKNQALLAKFQSLTKGTTTPDAVRLFVEKEIPDGAAFLAKVLTDFQALYLTNSSH